MKSSLWGIALSCATCFAFGCSDDSDSTTYVGVAGQGGSSGTGGQGAEGGAGGAGQGGAGQGGAGQGGAIQGPGGPCPDGFGQDTGTVFYVDPASGDDNNDGSQASPWASIQNVIDNKVDCTREDGTPHHTDAPVKAGDTIVLVGRDGHDQDIDISGCYNADWVTIRADQLHEAQIHNLHFRGSAYWRIDGLSFLNGDAATMIRIEDQDNHGEVHHIHIVNNFLTSGDLNTLQEYADRASTGIWLLHGPEQITVQCNHLFKVGQAMTVSGTSIDILNNKIEFFTKDAFATGGHNNRFIGNTVYDSIGLGDGHHDDFFQSHMGSNPDVSSNIEVAYNVFMNRYPPEQPADTYGPTQCLSAFGDGPKTNIRIYNNVCKTDHFHGIRWADTNDSIIINNTVIGGSQMPNLPPGSDDWPDHSWISIDGTNNVVRNNLTTLNQAGGENNLEITGADVDTYFVDFAALDLRLLPTAPAVDAGMADQAPADDVIGNARDGTPDVGAYEYVAGQ